MCAKLLACVMCKGLCVHRYSICTPPYGVSVVWLSTWCVQNDKQGGGA